MSQDVRRYLLVIRCRDQGEAERLTHEVITKGHIREALASAISNTWHVIVDCPPGQLPSLMKHWTNSKRTDLPSLFRFAELPPGPAYVRGEYRQKTGRPSR